ncbi:DUF3995 domain-containing protein [Mesorhizobium sp. MSK_1335]|uniref:DUF3995 domain-containing protein n=1 Tax=Mesorhizobium montanum TaxID=3072323 RepID=A0ABU4ZQA4_9HYPH|nr:DUF3995 domain-containing protein [Mesorhizobium sp. MSK_1335]MDX8527588.1 DUF3995 domain-containing protein [Mesorhizobium sp. MSK_1335]
METAIVAACSAVLLLGAGFHVYWGLGGRTGAGVSLPQREDGSPAVKETAAGALAVGVVLVLVLLLLLGFAGLIQLPIPRRLLKIGLILWALIFTLRALSWSRYFGLFKRVRNTRFGRYDSLLYSPSCLLLGLGLFCLAMADAGIASR